MHGALEASQSGNKMEEYEFKKKEVRIAFLFWPVKPGECLLSNPGTTAVTSGQSLSPLPEKNTLTSD